MATSGQFDATEFKQYQEHYDFLKSKHSERNTTNDRMDQLYWMEWTESSKVTRQGENVKLTLSPRAREKVKGFVRLLTAADPEWSVPHDKNDARVHGVSSKMEKFIKAMWFAGGRVRKSPIHYDMVLSAALYAETHLAISSTKDLLDRAPQDKPGVLARLERIHERTPYIFDVWHPSQGYPEFDSMGLRGFGRRFSLSATEICEQWEDGKAVLRLKNKEYGPFDKFNLRMLYTLEKQIVWVEGIARPLYLENHGLPFIPIVAQIVDGSNLFEKEEQRREPFLWSLAQSNLPERQNLLLTVMFTMAYALGTSPMFNYQSVDPDRKLKIDKSGAISVVRTQVGERFDQVNPNIIDPSLLQTWQMAMGLEEEATIHGQTLGEPLSGNTPYSSAALFSQAGRLPLVMPQKTLSWALGEAAEICLRWMKKDKRTGYARAQEFDVILKPGEIPDQFEIEAQLEMSLPYDQQLATNIALMGTQGDDPLFSHRYAREKILKIGQSDDMQEEVWTQQSSALKAKKYMLDLLAQIAQAEQMAMQPAQASGIPGAEGMMGPAMPAGMETEGSAPQISEADMQNPFPPQEPVPPLA